MHIPMLILVQRGLVTTAIILSVVLLLLDRLLRDAAGKKDISLAYLRRSISSLVALGVFLHICRLHPGLQGSSFK